MTSATSATPPVPAPPADRDACLARDAADPLAPFRAEFLLPEGVVYLDGNSLGALPRAAPAAVAHTIEEEWGRALVTSWNDAGWWESPRTLGALAAPLVGAAPDEVVVGDGTTANLYKTAVTALRLAGPGRGTLLGEAGAFPTDAYIADAAAETAGGAHRRVALADAPGSDAEVLEAELAAGGVGAVLLGHVDFRTGRLRDMAALTALAHRYGALAVWDLCHSAGAVPVDLAGAGADFAVGCTYKYLNGGPGAASFLFAAARHHEAARQPLPGWHGHARPFDFDPAYEPAPGASRFLSGSRPVVAEAPLRVALEMWSRADMGLVRAKSLALTDLFLDRVAAAPELVPATPLGHGDRGSQVALRHPDAFPIVQALIARGVIGDFRAPDLLRFGFTPLYLSFTEVHDAAATLLQVLESGEWRDPRFSERSTVT
ncbi:kynureninase [Nocardiopsis coralliicola]